MVRPLLSAGRWGRSPSRVVAVLAGVALVLAVVAAVGAGAPLAASDGAPVDAKLRTLDGEKLRLSDLRGRPLLLELWATWCLPCREQSRVLHDLEPELEASGVRVLAVNLGEAPDLARSFLEERPTKFEVGLDRGRVLARLFDVPELPALVLLDAEGRTIGVHRGLAEREEVRALLAPVGRRP